MAKDGKNGNGALLKILLSIVALCIVLFGISQTSGMFQGEVRRDVKHNHEEIGGINAVLKDEIKPDLARSISHVERDEIDTPYIKRDMADLKKDFTGFRTEQRTVNTKQDEANTEIINLLKALPKKDPE